MLKLMYAVLLLLLWNWLLHIFSLTSSTLTISICITRYYDLWFFSTKYKILIIIWWVVSFQTWMRATYTRQIYLAIATYIITNTLTSYNCYANTANHQNVSHNTGYGGDMPWTDKWMNECISYEPTLYFISLYSQPYSVICICIFAIKI